MIVLVDAKRIWNEQNQVIQSGAQSGDVSRNMNEQEADPSIPPHPTSG